MSDDELDLEALKRAADRDPRSLSHLRSEDIETLKRYAERGVPTGSCFEAILANDLMDALGRADVFTVHRIPAIAAYVYNEMPPACWGSRRVVAAWLALHDARRKSEHAETKGDHAAAEEARQVVLRMVQALSEAHSRID